MKTGPTIEVDRDDESERRSSQTKEFRPTPSNISGKNFIKMNLAVKSCKSSSISKSYIVKDIQMENSQKKKMRQSHIESR